MKPTAFAKSLSEAQERYLRAEACADKLRDALDALGKLYNEVTAVQKLRTGHHDMWPSEVEPGRLIREAREAHDRMREGRK